MKADPGIEGAGFKRFHEVVSVHAANRSTSNYVASIVFDVQKVVDGRKSGAHKRASTQEPPAMTDHTRTFAETYAMRSRFYQLLGEAGKALADAYREADRENQIAIKELAFDAMKHWLVENYRYPADEIA